MYTASVQALQVFWRVCKPRGRRGPFRPHVINAAATAKFIPKLQKYLKQQPGGDALAEKVAGWGAYQDGSGRTCYVHPDNTRKAYRTKKEVFEALTA